MQIRQQALLTQFLAWFVEKPVTVHLLLVHPTHNMCPKVLRG